MNVSEQARERSYIAIIVIMMLELILLSLLQTNKRYRGKEKADFTYSKEGSVDVIVLCYRTKHGGQTFCIAATFERVREIK